MSLTLSGSWLDHCFRLNAAQRLKRFLHWPKMKHKTSDKLKKLVEGTSVSASEGVPVPVPLRERFSKPSTVSNHKRTLSVLSNVPSPIAKKKLASCVRHGVLQAVPNYSVPHRSRSSSFSKISVSSQSSSDTIKGGFVEYDVLKPSCSNTGNADGTKILFSRHGLVNKRLVNQYLLFGGSG